MITWQILGKSTLQATSLRLLLSNQTTARTLESTTSDVTSSWYDQLLSNVKTKTALMVRVDVSQRKPGSIKRDCLKREYWKIADNVMRVIGIRRWRTQSRSQSLPVTLVPRNEIRVKKALGTGGCRNETAMQNECAESLFCSTLLLPLQSYTPRGFRQRWPNGISKPAILRTRMVFWGLMYTFPGFPR